MDGEAPLWLRLWFEPEKRATPYDVGEVFEALDDALESAHWAHRVVDPVGHLSEYFSNPRPPHGMWWEELGSEVGPYGFDGSPITILRFRYGSPLALLSEIPWHVYATGTMWAFLAHIERFWNMPKRIRVESKRLDAEEAMHEREFWEQALLASDAEEKYWRSKHIATGRHLQGGAAPPTFQGRRGQVLDPTPPRSRKRNRPTA